MNRCLNALTLRAHHWRAGIFTALFALSTLAGAQQNLRNFPPTAQRGVMQIVNPPDILLNGNTARLAPGARIRGVSNLLVLSGSLVGQPFVVNYVMGSMGLVQDVWVLTATEARQPAPSSVAAAATASAASTVAPATP